MVVRRESHHKAQAGMTDVANIIGSTQLIRQERAGLTVDLHEARPMNAIANCVIFHERAQEITTMAPALAPGYTRETLFALVAPLLRLFLSRQRRLMPPVDAATRPTG